MNDKFNFFVPVEISKAGEKGQMAIEGVCSSAAQDSDGEYLDPSGFDFQPLLDKGFFNWNHQANKDASAILGRPTEAAVINGGKDFHVKGYLYKGSPQATAVYNLAQVLQNEDPSRRLGFSIEGQAIERDPINPKRVRRARITGIAITHCPKNPNTLLSIMKGEYSESFVKSDIDIETLITGYKNWTGNTPGGENYACEGDVYEYLQNNYEDNMHQHKDLLGALQKAMSVNIDINPESVEGTKKNFLTKSQVYDKIFEVTDEIEKARRIFNLVELTAEKLFDMKTGEYTDDVINKAFDILGSASLQKSEGADTTTTTTTTEAPADDNIQKGEEAAALQKSQDMENLAKSYLEKGMKKEEIEDEMQKSGYPLVECQGCIDKVISDAEAAKDGGAMEVLKKSLLSEFGDMLEKSEGQTVGAVQQLAAGLDLKFGAIAQILQSQNVQASTILEKSEAVDVLVKSMAADIEKIGNEPFPTKSATSVKAADKFAGSISGKTTGMAYELSKSEDRQALGNVMLAKAEELINLGRSNPMLEKAIADLEISKSLPQGVIPILSAMGIEVVN